MRLHASCVRLSLNVLSPSDTTFAREATLARNGTILIADGDVESRASMSRVFRRAGYVTTEVDSGAKALAAVRRLRPVLVLVDVQLPGISGYEVCHELREEYGDLMPIVFVSGTRTEPSDRVAGLLVGADDYLVKPFDPDELLARARRLITRFSARGSGARGHAAGSTLTKREREVLSLLAEGMQSGEIAFRLFISPKTVATHIQRILTKLGVHSRAEAVARAHREELIDPDATSSEAPPEPAASRH
jgi:DNA-binding NarL/FixJ family response regulator